MAGVRGQPFGEVLDGDLVAGRVVAREHDYLAFYIGFAEGYEHSCIGLALFFPWGMAGAQAPLVMLFALPVLVLKLALGGFLLATLEAISAKLRIFRVPEFLATAFLLAVIGLLVHLLLSK